MKIKTPEQLRQVISDLVDKAVNYKTIYDEDAMQALDSVKQERWKIFTLECSEIERKRRRKSELKGKVMSNN